MRRGDFLWLRLGDNADYEKFDSIREAGEHIASHLPPNSDNKIFVGGLRMSIPPIYWHLNYISIFWGDDDAGDAVEISDDEQLEIIEVVKSHIEKGGE